VDSFDFEKFGRWAGKNGKTANKLHDEPRRATGGEKKIRGSTRKELERHTALGEIMLIPMHSDTD